MNWTDNKSAQESLVILGHLSEQCAILGGPLAKRLFLLVREKDYHSLVSYEIDYNDVTLSVIDAIYSRQILGFYQKCEFLNLCIDKEAVAADRFVQAELACRETNIRFKKYEHDPSHLDHAVHRALCLAERKIRTILGDVPSLDRFEFQFGGGANTNVKYSLACPRAKLGVRLECSANLAPTVAEFLSEVPHWTAHHADCEGETSWLVSVDVVPGKVRLVPKNAKTHRTIELQPILNSFFQKGVGSYIRDRLKRFGVDLHNQTTNQMFAMSGSIDGRIATVDLRMASDCVARAVVWNLLPYDWACLLDSLRTPEVILPDALTDEIIREHHMDDIMGTGHPYRYEKFSSMGNGYTFELESVLFYGLCSAVVEVLNLDQDLVSVYGDDIIIPTGAYALLEQVMTFCGFSFNTEKSFGSGPFRESCGADFFHGFDIRPFYQKTLISERTLYTMHNWFIRHGEFELARIVCTYCNPDLLLYGPDGFGDGHLIGSYELRRNRNLKRQGWDGGYFDTYALRPNRFIDPLPGDAILPVYSVYTRSGEMDLTDPNVVRGSSGYAKVSIYTLVRDIFSRKP